MSLELNHVVAELIRTAASPTPEQAKTLADTLAAVKAVMPK